MSCEGPGRAAVGGAGALAGVWLSLRTCMVRSISVNSVSSLECRRSPRPYTTPSATVKWKHSSRYTSSATGVAVVAVVVAVVVAGVAVVVARVSWPHVCLYAWGWLLWPCWTATAGRPLLWRGGYQTWKL